MDCTSALGSHNVKVTRNTNKAQKSQHNNTKEPHKKTIDAAYNAITQDPQKMQTLTQLQFLLFTKQVFQFLKKCLAFTTFGSKSYIRSLLWSICSFMDA